RDLPNKAAEIPAKYKGQPWARLGVDVDGDFEPLYVVNTDKKAHVKKLKELMAEADELLLATDEDREGEAIAWHLREELKPKIPVRRMVFNEITEEAIQRAAHNTRDLNTRLVSAQETRRILDRLYGYEVSPVLWKKVMPKLSAGRVQSVATRLVVERERERIAFTSAEYWDLKAVFDATDAGTSEGPAAFPATLVSVDGSRVAVGRDFTSQGTLRSDRQVRHLDEAAARGLAERLAGAGFSVRSVERKPIAVRPTRRSEPPRASRRPHASWACRRSRPCRSLSGCTRTVTSPTCVPTAPRCRRTRSRPPVPRPVVCTVPTTCPTSRGCTPRR